MDLSVIAIAVGLLAYVLYAVYSSPAAGRKAPAGAAETVTPDEPPILAQTGEQPAETTAEEPEAAAADAGDAILSLETETAAETPAG
ncbi:hypothetical protein [Methylococcus capsulatus]|uniref:hypothetical protein n=1 Tax=Methylococcus capsulatus TaxID=414 RepID=UPI001C52DAB4|nr:hypothetical protein [Methylococcus capsulatus]QXP88627.1 hypothetical protein KW112_05805 [Methylococcus capsulatus]QXP94340.1 hypothetical protein KW113_03830 [Methylococcus capsulatus]UQN10903.1 hypothetical protein M3M30_07535 [Methylococcus capsulatus]